MFELKTTTPKIDRPVAPGGRPDGSQEPKQRRMMLVALVLLLVALGLVLYHDRNFWFPDTEEAEDQPPPQKTGPAVAATRSQADIAEPKSPAQKTSHGRKRQPKSATPANARLADPSTAPDTTMPTTPPGAVTTNRTVLPPLEIEVVAGDVHHAVHPGTNSVRVDLQPGSSAQPASEAPASVSASDTAAGVVRTAGERVQVSGDTAEIVSRPENPGYPLLARQMKVQGSVILQALIGRDGLIQDLRVLSGPPILASAAQEAVKQWHFKPHYLGADAVETQARITVNFTISTN
ncbi:MAG TPA: energy transducer TonB [Candidatus Sulfotelmatobacter sp.]|nr:energy transducer TonB [Candidatus Sulfotelmatobacter sp.]